MVYPLITIGIDLTYKRLTDEIWQVEILFSLASAQIPFSASAHQREEHRA